MIGQLASIYSETLAAQCALIHLADLETAGHAAAPAEWNAAEESLDAALERLRTYRLQVAPPSSGKWPSPGFAGGLRRPSPPLAVTHPPAGAAPLP